jgi:hypothetical protein
VRPGSNVSLLLLMAGLSLLISGCISTVSSGGIQIHEAHTSSGASVRITRISVPYAVFHKDVQVAAGSVWATAPGIFSQKTVRLDPRTYQVKELSRPFSSTGSDLLVDGNAMWLADTLTGLAGSGDLIRIDLDSNKAVAAIDGAGSPFATDDDTVWAYNHRTGVVTGIGIGDNRVRTEIATRGSKSWGSMTLGAGSLWQSVLEGDVIRKLRRINPWSGEVLAEISVGPICPTDQIRYVAGAIWVIGGCGEDGAESMTRVDVVENRVVATIPLPKSAPCVANTRPRTPVEWNGAVWISTFCTGVGRAPGRLLKVDLQDNEIVDQLFLSESHGHQGGQPDLAVGEGAVWGFDGRSALRFDF